MAKNIVIFSDGTGQRSGERFEENRTNVYKLYRASKCGPDTSVDARQQFAFYDAGIGTTPPQIGFLGALWSKLYNLVCQATGLGLTHNIKDCYKTILKVYEPGDRIFLFGFSRGAYTVRCLAAVLHYCGIPTKSPDGKPLRKDPKTLEAIAAEAVEKVYQHVGYEQKKSKDPMAPPIVDRFASQRMALGELFQEKFASEIAYPHFIGVFDTVASVANYASMAISVAIGLALAAGMALLLELWLGGFWWWFSSIVLTASFVGMLYFLKTHLKVAFGLKDHPWWTTAHLNPIRMRFYDKALNAKVGWARHALAIDEHRKDFNRVAWGDANLQRQVGPGEPAWLKQWWFAGNHADIGGGYPETESRLSDAALEWMVAEARSIPDPLIVDDSVLRPYPSPDGMQHDETQSLVFRFAAKHIRDIDPHAELHPLVYERLVLPVVLQLFEEKPYRPENLKTHGKAREYFTPSDIYPKSDF